MEELVCPVCGKIFYGNAPAKTCSPECAKNYEEQRKQEKRYERKCVICGASFISSHSAAFYCSKACAKKGNRENQKIWQKRPGMRACHDCGKPTVDYRCSSCWDKLRRKHGLSVSESNDEDITYGKVDV